MASRTEIAEKEPPHRLALSIVLCAGVLALLAVAAVGLPDDHAPLPAVARQAMAAALPSYRTTEVVSAVVYGIRGFDTFGETFLLMAAVVSVVVLTRGREPRHGYSGEEAAAYEEQQEDDPHPEPSVAEQRARAADAEEEAGGATDQRDHKDPHDDTSSLPRRTPSAGDASSIVIRLAVRTALPLLAVACVYLVVQGYSPGGGFPAGCLALGVVLLVYASAGYRAVRPIVRPDILETGELIAAVAVIACFALGLPLAGSVSANWIPLAPEQTLRSGGVVQVFSLLEFVEVATGLAIAIFSILSMRHEWSPDGNDETGASRQ